MEIVHISNTICKTSTSDLAVAILDFRLPVMSGRIRNSPIEMLDLENVGETDEIELLSNLQAELYLIPM